MQTTPAEARPRSDGRRPEPIIVKIGSVSVKIYCVPSGGKKRWEVRDHFGGRGHTHRRKFSSRKGAQLYAEQRGIIMSNGNTARYRLTDAQLLRCERALEICAQVGKEIDQLAFEERARWEICRKLSIPPGLRVAEIVERYLKAQRASGFGAYHLRDLGTRLNRFAESFQLPLLHVTAEQLRAWLDGLGVSGRTWNNYRASLVALFTWAKDAKCLPGDWSELDSIKAIELPDSEPVVYTPAEFRRIIEAATPEKFQILLAISAFAGIRSEEITKLNWEDFDWQAGYIFLRKRIVKGKAGQKKQRQVPIADNLAEWLAPYRSNSGPVSTYKNPKVVAGMKTKLAVRLGIKWGKNALRKSWISYQLALTQDAGKVARWAGNSPGIISSTYERLVTPDAAREWFEIRPTTVTQGILKLAFPAQNPRK